MHTAHNSGFYSERHVSEIASMALDLLAGSVVFQIPHRPNSRLNIRMGVHRLDQFTLISYNRKSEQNIQNSQVFMLEKRTFDLYD